MLDAIPLLRANETFGDTLGPDVLADIEQRVAACVSAMLEALGIADDHNTADTPARVARMLVRETFAGRYTAPPALTDFPNVGNLDQLYAVGPIAFRSCCAHHLVPILGQAWIGVLPTAR